MHNQVKKPFFTPVTLSQILAEQEENILAITAEGEGGPKEFIVGAPPKES